MSDWIPANQRPNRPQARAWSEVNTSAPGAMSGSRSSEFVWA